MTLIDAAENGPKDTMEQTNGQARSGEGGGNQTRDAAPESPSDGWDAASHGLLLRPADVRSVRREERAHPVTHQARSLVVADWVASTEAVDSYESILIADWDQGGRLGRFLANPVLLWAHNRESIARPAIGHCENVRVQNNELLLTVVCDDTTEFDREIAAKIEKRVIRAGSVGFAWGEAKLRTVDDQEVVVFSKNELREFTICNVGANPEALAQRDLVMVARDLARANGTAGMRDVATAYRERFSRIPTTRTISIPSPTPPEPPQQRATAPTAKPGAPKEQIMKTVTIDVRACRAAPSTAPCPACNEALAVLLTNLPEHDEKAVVDLTTRATTAEGKLTETARALEVMTSERDSAKTRLATVEPELATVRAENEKSRAAAIGAEVDRRIPAKIYPNERATEIKLATVLLADRAPDPESKDANGNPTRTLGEKAWRDRLSEIDARADIGMAGPPITGGNQNQNHGAGKDPQARNLAAEIDEILAKEPLALRAN